MFLQVRLENDIFFFLVGRLENDINQPCIT